MKKLGDGVCFAQAPEICVEVISPGNSESEIEEKKALYFDAGAREVWICAADGSVSFFGAGATAPLQASKACPNFPRQLKLG
jgi:hypothetical protein